MTAAASSRATQDPRVDMLEKRIADLEALIRTITLRTMLTDPAAVNSTPNGYIEAAIGTKPIRIPYFSAS